LLLGLSGMSRNPLLIATKGVASVVGGSSFAPETPVVLFLRISLQTEKKKWPSLGCYHKYRQVNRTLHHRG
jgi:hypothetical protein